jgi:DNA-directed RNA polymerase alpha subunit
MHGCGLPTPKHRLYAADMPRNQNTTLVDVVRDLEVGLTKLGSRESRRQVLLYLLLQQSAPLLLARHVSSLRLNARASKCVERMNITTIGELIAHTGGDLLSAPNFGPGSLKEIEEKLKALGLALAGS